MTKPPDEETAGMIEAFGDGFLRDIAERAGRIIGEKVKAMGLPEPVDPVALAASLDREALQRLMREAWMEAAIETFPQADPAKIAGDVEAMLQMFAMEGEATHDGSDAVN